MTTSQHEHGGWWWHVASSPPFLSDYCSYPSNDLFKETQHGKYWLIAKAAFGWVFVFVVELRRFVRLLRRAPRCHGVLEVTGSAKYRADINQATCENTTSAAIDLYSTLVVEWRYCYGRNLGRCCGKGWAQDNHSRYFGGRPFDRGHCCSNWSHPRAF